MQAIAPALIGAASNLGSDLLGFAKNEQQFKYGWRLSDQRFQQQKFLQELLGQLSGGLQDRQFQNSWNNQSSLARLNFNLQNQLNRNVLPQDLARINAQATAGNRYIDSQFQNSGIPPWVRYVGNSPSGSSPMSLPRQSSYVGNGRFYNASVPGNARGVPWNYNPLSQNLGLGTPPSLQSGIS